MHPTPIAHARATSRVMGALISLVVAGLTALVLFAPAGAAEHEPPEALLGEVRAQAADAGVAERPGDVEVLRTEAVTWSDACLGASETGEFCAQVLTDGFAIWVQSGPEALRYHIGTDAGEVRLGERTLDPAAVDDAEIPADAALRDAEPADDAPAPEPETYTVQAGDTLGAIASQFGVTVDEIAEANEIANVNVIEVGQVLEIPGTAGEPEPDPGQTAEYVSYTVQPGDTLYAIAIEHGVTVQSIIDANHPAAIPSPDRIEVGAVLLIRMEVDDDPVPEPMPDTYTVQAGDTLYSIATGHGVTVNALANLNDIANVNMIHVGQVLRLP